MSGPVNIDPDEPHSDWIKHGDWDLSTDPKAFTQAQLEHLATLPVWSAAPPSIRRALGRPDLTADSDAIPPAAEPT